MWIFCFANAEKLNTAQPKNQKLERYGSLISAERPTAPFNSDLCSRALFPRKAFPIDHYCLGICLIGPSRLHVSLFSQSPACAMGKKQSVRKNWNWSPSISDRYEIQIFWFWLATTIPKLTQSKLLLGGTPYLIGSSQKEKDIFSFETFPQYAIPFKILQVSKKRLWNFEYRKYKNCSKTW